MFCSHCGQSLVEVAKFCPNCGTEIIGTQSQIESNEPYINNEKIALVKDNRKLSKRLGLIIVSVFVLLFGVGCGGYYYYQYQILPQSLYEESLELVESGQYSEAMTNLEKAISLKHNDEFITLLTTLQIEKETVDLINLFYESLTEVAADVNRANTLAELNRLCTSLLPFVEKISALSLEGDSEVATFTRKLKGNGMYQLFAEDYATGDSISKLSSTSIFISDLVLNSAKTLVGNILNEILWIKRPDCFEIIN